MKKLVLALTAVAAFTGSAFAADLPARTYTKAPDDGRPVRTGPASTSSAAAAAASGMLTQHRRDHGAGNAARPSISARAVTAGSARSVLAMTGSSTSWVVGIFADGQFGSLKGTIQDRPRLDRQREGAGHLGCRRACRLPGRAERSFLRQWWLHRVALVGHDAFGTQRRRRSASTPTASTAMAGSSVAASKTT